MKKIRKFNLSIKEQNCESETCSGYKNCHKTQKVYVASDPECKECYDDAQTACLQRLIEGGNR